MRFIYLLFIASSLLIAASFTAQTNIVIHMNTGENIEIPVADIDSISFSNDNPGEFVQLTMGNALGFGATSAVFFVEITDDGGSEITNKGICWSTEQEPTTADNQIEMGSGVGSFQVEITDLDPSSTYYVRAYSINTAGTTYSVQRVVQTYPILNYSAMEMGMIGNGLNYNGVQHNWDVTFDLSFPELIDGNYTWTFNGVETNTEEDAAFKIREGQDWTGFNIGSWESIITGSLGNEITVTGDGTFGCTVDGAMYNLTLLINQDTGLPTLIVEPG